MASKLKLDKHDKYWRMAERWWHIVIKEEDDLIGELAKLLRRVAKAAYKQGRKDKVWSERFGGRREH